jgi:formamidopyrimidine-DNA glycosylase
LEHGADRSIEDYKALEWADSAGHKRVVDLLKNYFPDSNKRIEKNLKDYNTDGRLTCYQCGKPLKIVTGFTGSNFNYCPECES